MSESVAEESLDSTGLKGIAVSDADFDFAGVTALQAAVSMVSLGAGRFGLISSLRRHLWSNTKILGDSLSYDGDAWPLALRLGLGLAPLAAIFFSAYRFGSILTGDMEAYMYLLVAILSLAYWRALHFASWRYRLNHTLWRGHRFRAGGSVIAYFLLACAWGAASAASLGLFWPSTQVALDRYKLKHTHFGSRSFQFVGEGSALLRRGFFLLPLWLWSRVLLCFFGVSIWLCYSAYNEDMSRWELDLEDSRMGSAADAAGRCVTLSALMVVLLLPIAAFAYPRFVALVWKWRLEGIRFGNVYVTSSLTLSSLMGLYFAFYGIIAAIVSLALLASSALKGVWSGDETLQRVTIFYFCAIPLDGVWNWIFAGRFWVIIVGSLTLHNASELIISDRTQAASQTVAPL